jgi:hypothetical protein
MKRININTKTELLDRIINKFFKSGLEKRYLNKFFKKVPNTLKSRNKNILIYAGIGHMYSTPLEVLMYHLLIDKGLKVDYSIYDENIPSNEVITRERVKNYGKERFWNNSVKNAQRFLKHSKVNYEFITYDEKVDFLIEKNKNSIESILKFEYEGIKFGEIVKGALYRFYKSYSYEDDVLVYAKKFMYTALTNYFYFKKKIDQKKYKYIIFSHGIYCTWAPIAKYCESIGQDYICYDRAKTNGYVNFNLNKPAPVWDISQAWDRLKNYSLNSSELNKVNHYLSERELQKEDVFAYNFKRKEKNLKVLRDKLRIKPNDSVITIFTNLIWDAANVSREIAFKDVIDCIVKTIDRFKKNSGVHILLRPHPAEEVLGTNERYEDLLMERFNNALPENVTIIKNEEKINSFSVIELSDIGVVNTSTIGLEMAIEGKPTIIISDTHYRNKGFTYDARSEDHYFQIINKILTSGHTLPNQIQLAKKYFYLMMFEYQHKMPLEVSSLKTFDGYGHKSFDKLKSDKNEKINIIVDRIISDSFSDFVFR